jgi:hypothetical protein
MAQMIRLSCWIYGRLLNFYPRELRAEFGNDMVEVFEDLLCEVTARRGISGLASVWGTSLWELMSVAMPSRLQKPTVIAGAVSLVVSSVIAWVFFRAVG